MADQRIILEFIGDASGLKPAVESLKTIAGLTQEQVASFDKANASFKVRTAEIGKQTTETTKLTTAVKGTGESVEELANKTKKIPPEVQKARDSITQFNQSVKQSVTSAQALGQKWTVIPKVVDEAAKKSKGFSETMNGLLTSAKGLALTLGIAFGVQQIIAYGREAVQLAAKAEGVERAFQRVGSPEILDGLREATRGTVSDLVLMQNAVKASNFKIPLEQMANLFKFAQSRARETGESVDYLVDSIILGIGRKSPLILDNLGISAISLREKFNGLSAEAATVGDVAKAVGEIATEQLAKIGVQADTTADKLAQLTTVMQNWQTKAGAVLVELATVALYAVGAIEKADDRLGLAAANAIKFQAQINAQLRAGTITAEQLLSRELAIREELNKSGQRKEQIDARLLELASQRKSLSNVAEVTKETAALKAEIEQLATTVIYQKAKLEVLRNIRKERMGQREGIASGEEIKNVAYYTAKLELLNAEQKEVNTTLVRNNEINKEKLILQAELDKLLGKELEEKKAKAAVGSIAALNDELAELKTQLENAKIGSVEFYLTNVKVKDKAEELRKALLLLQAAVIQLEKPTFSVGSQSFDNKAAAEDAINALRDSQELLARETIGSEKELDLQLLKIDAANIMDRIQLNKDAGDSTVQLEIELTKKLKELRDKQADDYVEALDKEKKAREKSQEEKRENLDQFAADVEYMAQVASGISQGIGDIQRAATEAELQNLESLLEAGQITREEYDQKRKELLNQQAEDDKARALFQATVNGLSAVLTAYASGGAVEAAIAAIFVAAELATIAATPIPKFAKGTKNAPEGFKWVGEEGAELVYDGGGYPIITHRESNRIAADPFGVEAQSIMDKYDIPRITGTNWGSMKLRESHSSGVIERTGSIDYDRLGSVIASHSQFPDSNMIRAIDRHRISDRKGAESIASALRDRSKKRGGYA